MTRNRWLNNTNGFSVVEMMAALLIAGSIIGVVGSFLVIHLKSYSVTQSVVDVQYEAQIALNQMSEIVMESKGVCNLSGAYQILDQNRNNLATNVGPSTPWLIVFEGERETAPNTYQTVYFAFLKKIGSADHTVYYLETTDTSKFSALSGNTVSSDFVEFARNVTNMTVSPGKESAGSNEDFISTKSIEISFEFQD
ncbi:hypothetical protein H7X64_02915, partial [Armatimonadetes bacterium]|nr:hypothetical protein [bacterium]